MIGNVFECIAWLTTQDTEKRYEVKELKRRRSLTQNAYYWVMLNKLARKLRMPDHEVHLNMLRDYGVHEVFSIMDSVPIDGYFKYYDIIGKGTVNGRTFKHVMVYKGSSQMDSTEFSHLIDGMRDECAAQGIDVATPEEIAEMKWVEHTR